MCLEIKRPQKQTGASPKTIVSFLRASHRLRVIQGESAMPWHKHIQTKSVNWAAWGSAACKSTEQITLAFHKEINAVGVHLPVAFGEKASTSCILQHEN